jgi:hypothetical protein
MRVASRDPCVTCDLLASPLVTSIAVIAGDGIGIEVVAEGL